jgi:hypothetical protein
MKTFDFSLSQEPEGETHFQELPQGYAKEFPNPSPKGA